MKVGDHLHSSFRLPSFERSVPGHRRFAPALPRLLFELRLHPLRPLGDVRLRRRFAAGQHHGELECLRARCEGPQERRRAVRASCRATWARPPSSALVSTSPPARPIRCALPASDRWSVPLRRRGRLWPRAPCTGPGAAAPPPARSARASSCGLPAPVLPRRTPGLRSTARARPRRSLAPRSSPAASSGVRRISVASARRPPQRASIRSVASFRRHSTSTALRYCISTDAPSLPVSS